MGDRKSPEKSKSVRPAQALEECPPNPGSSLNYNPKYVINREKRPIRLDNCSIVSLDPSDNDRGKQILEKRKSPDSPLKADSVANEARVRSPAKKADETKATNVQLIALSNHTAASLRRLQVSSRFFLAKKSSDGSIIYEPAPLEFEHDVRAGRYKSIGGHGARRSYALLPDNSSFGVMTHATSATSARSTPRVNVTMVKKVSSPPLKR